MKRPYFFEIFVLANLAVLLLLVQRGEMPLLAFPQRVISQLVMTIAGEAALGVLIRSLVAAVRREHGYFRILRSRRWLLDSVRIVIGAALVIYIYGWIKLVVPIVHPTLYDQALWDLDQLLFFGIAPTILVLDLFGQPVVLRAVDWSYANIFAASIVIGAAYFLSDASRRVRIGFANGYAVLWIAGAWLYMLVPSLGPAYRFPEVWMAHGDNLQLTQKFQAILMRNYQNVIRAWHGQPHGSASIMFGIGAFPSLHVGFQTYVFLWMRRLWTSGEVLFGIFVATIFLGSMITGWHYFVDGVAGFLLALACYKLFARRAKLRRWLELRRR
ncbi:MAG TPA: phosphatase PAP2 family protein [Thermoanaerobaculia bacterium]|nr:phosphatase PAP2 family protein [Thermoanaerobaculia bacterium]